MKRSGFTLLELLVVMAILMLLMGLILTGVNIARARGRMLQARRDVDQIKTALYAYLGDYRTLPNGVTETGEDFVAIMRGENVDDANPRKYKYMDFHEKSSGMRDPWENFYQFEPDEDNHSVRIWSYGEDKEDGTDDDVRSWRSLEQ